MPIVMQALGLSPMLPSSAPFLLPVQSPGGEGDLVRGILPLGSMPGAAGWLGHRARAPALKEGAVWAGSVRLGPGRAGGGEPGLARWEGALYTQLLSPGERSSLILLFMGSAYNTRSRGCWPLINCRTL